jgi:hypothetical protein
MSFSTTAPPALSALKPIMRKNKAAMLIEMNLRFLLMARKPP